MVGSVSEEALRGDTGRVGASDGWAHISASVLAKHQWSLLGVASI